MIEPGGRTKLAREMGVLGLTATGVCAMVGAGINIIPFMIQRNVPGIGPYVLPAFLFAALPAVLAGLAYAILSSAMPRAGGSYVYASRGLSPYLGFVASFSQWFALCIAIGVVSYVLVPFIRDVALAAEWRSTAAALETGWLRLSISIGVLWAAVAANLRGIAFYERLVVPLMFLTFALGSVVIVAGFWFDANDFAAALMAREGRAIPDVPASFRPWPFVSAAAVLFASFIGFDAIAQAGGEARQPGRNLPLAIGLAVGSVALFYLLFTAAVYHAVPWQYVADEAVRRDVTAPGLLGLLLPPFWTVIIVSAAAIALAKDLPAMLLATSRLMFAWAEDGIVPRGVAAVHTRYRTPHVAVIISGLMATLGVLGSHLAGDFFLGVDILVTAMLVNFLLMAVSVLTLPRKNAVLARAITVLPNPTLRVPLAVLAVVVIGCFLVVHTIKDLTSPAAAWYFRSTWLWAAVMAAGSIIYWREVANLKAAGVDLQSRFAALPPE
ncbi:MAG TPA: APC family permease [Vicinamibacterales bacterium]|nr:APC family permease [Vicinamibacterales bacterium]